MKIPKCLSHILAHTDTSRGMTKFVPFQVSYFKLLLHSRQKYGSIRNNEIIIGVTLAKVSCPALIAYTLTRRFIEYATRLSALDTTYLLNRNRKESYERRLVTSIKRDSDPSPITDFVIQCREPRKRHER